jgi:ribonuclease Z
VEIVFLGTGCPVASPERYGPAQLVLADGVKILVDCGSGVTQRLVAAGTAGRDLDALLLTHLHSDHLVDLYQLIVSNWTVWRDRPLPVFGPPGTRRYVEALMALWEPELSGRIAHEQRPSTAALETEVTEIAPGQTLTFGETAVDVIEVDHRPVRHAFGFVFRRGALTLALSGDTRRCPALIEAARGADLLVHEVFVHRELRSPPGVDRTGTFANLASYHTLSSEVGKIATDAAAKALALTHIVPPGADRAALLAEAGADFRGPLVVAEDLLRIDLAARRIIHRDLFVALGSA